jgi:hypothetical protein
MFTIADDPMNPDIEAPKTAVLLAVLQTSVKVMMLLSMLRLARQRTSVTLRGNICPRDAGVLLTSWMTVVL